MDAAMLEARSAPITEVEGPKWIALMRRVAGGDQAALGELYDATSPIVLGLIRRIVSDHARAEEIALDVYTRVWRLAPTYDQSKSTPLTWMLMLARTRAIDHRRSRASRARERERPIEAAFSCSHPAPNPETAALSESRRRIIQGVLSELTPEQLEVLRLAFFDGLSHIEISEETGIPLGTVKSRIRAGMTRLRELLGPRVGAL